MGVKFSLGGKQSVRLMWEGSTGLARGFLVILALTYGPRPYGPEPLGPYGPGPFIIQKNFLGQIRSRTIFEIHSAPGACLLYAPMQYAFQIWSWSIFIIFFKIINGPGP